MRDVFDELFEKYHHDIFTFLFYMTNNREQAEDLVQEVYIRVFKSYEGFRGNSSEKTWLYSIARHVAIDHFRKNKSWKQKVLATFDWTRDQIMDTTPLPEDLTLLNEQSREIYEWLEKCSVDHRAVIVLRYIQSYSISETSDILGWSESKVKTTQHRALKKLKELMVKKVGKEVSSDARQEVAR